MVSAPMSQDQLAAVERDASRFRWAVGPAFRALSAYFSPEFHGLERVPQEGPVILVGNHTVTGSWDTAVLQWELWNRRGIPLFTLGDHFHYKVPLWRGLLHANATVEGTPQNCGALLDDGRHVLVFPGGAREVFKRKGEKYELFWRERTGFARMALSHGAALVPFAAVGGEEMFDIVFDNDDLLASPLGPLAERIQGALGFGGDGIMPLVRGWGPLPKRTRLFYEFGDPIRIDPAASDTGDPELARDLRDRAKAAVEAGLARLLREQAASHSS